LERRRVQVQTAGSALQADMQWTPRYQMPSVLIVLTGGRAVVSVHLERRRARVQTAGSAAR
jgi:hypothetical protein